MKIGLSVLASILIAGINYTQPAYSQVQVQPAPGFSAQIGPGAPPPPERRDQRLRDREGFYGPGSEDRGEERGRLEHRARERCHHIADPIERDRCFDHMR